MTETIVLGLLEDIYLTVISSFPYCHMQVQQSDEQTRGKIMLNIDCNIMLLGLNSNKNSSGDEIANVNFLTTISHTRRPTSKYRKRDKPTSFNKLDDR